MGLTLKQMTNGLTPEHDLFFPEQPDNPEMRESTSIWLYEENGAFGFPRIGIEAEAHSWDNRLFTANFALGGGRVLGGMGRGPAPSPLGPDGRPTVFGAGPLTFECVEPFRKWRMTFDGSARDGRVSEQIAKTFEKNKEIPVRLEVEMEMQTPAWVHDYSPEKVAKMTETEKEEASSMGLGWRLEHLFRGEGALTIDGETRTFKGLGSRIKRQSVRPLAQFRGHSWQAALFPDGRAFGYVAYPPFEDGREAFNDGYIFQDGKMFPARVVRIPWLREVVADGDDVSLELESELGTTKIGGVTAHATFKVHNPDMAALGAVGFTLQQSGACYTWDGMTSYGMLERSSTDDQMAK